jgi:hypothetical protein
VGTGVGSSVVLLTSTTGDVTLYTSYSHHFFSKDLSCEPVMLAAISSKTPLSTCKQQNAIIQFLQID